MLKRTEMEEILARRESVLYDGRIITSLDELPSEAELAKAVGDKQRQEDAKRDLKEKLKRFASELASLEANEEVEAPKAEAKAEVKKAPVAEAKPAASEKAADVKESGAEKGK